MTQRDGMGREPVRTQREGGSLQTKERGLRLLNSSPS